MIALYIRSGYSLLPQTPVDHREWKNNHLSLIFLIFYNKHLLFMKAIYIYFIYMK